ncbi:unnamed protein product [Brassica oleracea]
MVDREMVTEAIIYHDLPFRYVEYEKTAALDVYRRYEIEKEKLKGLLNSKILEFCEMKSPHTCDLIATKIFDGSDGGLLSDACVERVGIRGGAGLSLDVPTRWNSTYEMLVRALKFKEAFASMESYDQNYKTNSSVPEWNRGAKICELLKPFSDYCVILAMGAALDPRIKIDMLEAAYKEVDPITASVKTEKLKESLSDLYKEYQKLSQTIPQTGVRHSTFESLRLGRSSQSIDFGFLRFWDSLNFKKDREFVRITDFFELEKSIGASEQQYLAKATHKEALARSQPSFPTVSPTAPMIRENLVLEVAHLATEAANAQQSSPKDRNEHVSERLTHTARSLCCYRARAKARSLRSDRARTRLGRYVATEFEPKLDFYVATELKPKLATSLRSDRAQAKTRSLRSDRARANPRSLRSTELEPMLGRYVANEHAHGSVAT